MRFLWELVQTSYKNKNLMALSVKLFSNIYCPLFTFLVYAKILRRRCLFPGLYHMGLSSVMTLETLFSKLSVHVLTCVYPCIKISTH